MFDAQSFLSQTVNAANATTIPPIPDGDYNATVKELKPRVNNDGSVVLDVIWDIDDAALKEQLNRKVITVRQGIFLDVDDSGALKTGESDNVALGRLRAAVGQNSSDNWSPSMLIGQAAKIHTTQKTDKDGVIRDNVTKVASLFD